MNINILLPEVQKFIIDHINDDLVAILLKGSPFENVSAEELINQISGRSKSIKKHPFLLKSEGVIFPAKVSLEQSSSQLTAEYKSSLFSGKKGIDLTGGMGVDSYFLSNSITDFTYCERHQELFEITKHNFNVLKKEQINYYHGDGIEFLNESNEQFDLIYIDPARRDKNNGKKYKLEETEPNVVKHLDLLFSKGKTIAIKTSPMLDLNIGIRALKRTIEIHIISIKNEVKEILWLLKSDNINHEKQISIKTLNFNSGSIEKFNFTRSEERNIQIDYSEIKQFVFIPNAAIMKSGAFKMVSNRFSVGKIHEHSHIYTHESRINFPGRTFKVKEQIPYNKKLLKSRFGKLRFNILKRNYPESVANIRKKTGIQEGGDEYLIFTTDKGNNRVVLFGELLD